jgi:hypothetical protein
MKLESLSKDKQKERKKNQCVDFTAESRGQRKELVNFKIEERSYPN